jgi:hypothetical protein
MRFFTIDTIADGGVGDYCFTDHTPDGLETNWYRLATGVPFDDEYPYPASPDDVRLRLGDDNLGLKLPSFIGNTSGMLVVDNKTADLIVSRRVGEIERLPFVLVNHKKRIHSRDYVFLNPLEKIECLNLEQSKVRRSTKGEVLEVTKIVLDRSREKDLPDLCRLGEEPSVYLCSETLVTALEEAGCTNFVFNPLSAK